MIDLSKVAERDRHSPYPLVPMDKAIDMVMEQATSLGTQQIHVQGNNVISADRTLNSDFCFKKESFHQPF